MLAELGLGIAGLCLVGGAWWAGRMQASMNIGERRVLTLPLDPDTGREALLVVPWQMTEVEWERLTAQAQAMASGLVVHTPRRRSSRDERLDAQREHEAEVMEDAQDDAIPRVHPFGRR